MSDTRIKICGLYRPCDAEYVNAAMPDYAGFVFYEKSTRNVSMKQAKEIRLTLHQKIITVGVFVNAPKEKINTLFQENIISIIQLHGSESNEYILELRNMLPGAKIWKAYKIRSASDIKIASQSAADMVILDNGYGTGECFDWSLIEDYPLPYILAGGLTPNSIPNAILRLHPYAVDISSGVESNGVKDRCKILEAVAATRNN